jgi:hypothetical protein
MRWHRRTSKDYERLTENSEAVLYISMIDHDRPGVKTIRQRVIYHFEIVSRGWKPEFIVDVVGVEVRAGGSKVRTL